MHRSSAEVKKALRLYCRTGMYGRVELPAGLQQELTASRRTLIADSWAGAQMSGEARVSRQERGHRIARVISMRAARYRNRNRAKDRNESVQEEEQDNRIQNQVRSKLGQ